MLDLIFDAVEAGLHNSLNSNPFIPVSHLVSILLCRIGTFLLNVFDELVEAWFFQHELIYFVSVDVCFICENILHKLIDVFIL